MEKPKKKMNKFSPCEDEFSLIMKEGSHNGELHYCSESSAREQAIESREVWDRVALIKRETKIRCTTLEIWDKNEEKTKEEENEAKKTTKPPKA